MKNYLLFIIDSLNYKHVQESSIVLMPFMERIKKQAVSCENMFAQAPYTEAAVMNIYCGQDVLVDGGYLLRFKNAKSTIFEEMRKHGYITYFNSYQPQCYPSSIRRGIDYIYYNVGYDQGTLWSYRLQHYAKLHSKNMLTERDYRILADILEDNFKEWLIFVNNLLSNDESVDMISKNANDYNAIFVHSLVQKEYDNFKKSNNKYIEQILLQGLKHKFFKIPAYVQDSKISQRKIVKEICKVWESVFWRIQIMQFKLNILNCKNLFKGVVNKLIDFLSNPTKINFKNFLKSGYLMVNELVDTDLFQRIKSDCDMFKNSPSARMHIDHYINWAKIHKQDANHFACIHIDDIHNPEIFFTYDSSDIELIKREKTEAEQLLNEIPKNYFGNLTHDLSLRYMDGVIKYLYERLENENLLKDTCIIICADHGFSFSGNPLRDSFVVNLYLENYKIPCIITDSEMPPQLIYDLKTSKDIPATICQMAFNEIPHNFSGHYILEKDVYQALFIEYCGGGCPDMERRELKIAAFDKNYFVGTLCNIYNELDDNSVTEVYNLNNDPLQLCNLKKSKCILPKREKFIDLINKERSCIRNSML